MTELPKGTRVRIARDDGRSKEWGTISDCNESTYCVKRDSVGEVWVEREKLETLDDLGRFVPIRVRAIERRIGYEQRQKLERDLLDAQIDSSLLLELVKQYDIMLIFRDGEIRALIDRQGCRWRQM